MQKNAVFYILKLNNWQPSTTKYKNQVHLVHQVHPAEKYNNLSGGDVVTEESISVSTPLMVLDASITMRQQNMSVTWKL